MIPGIVLIGKIPFFRKHLPFYQGPIKIELIKNRLFVKKKLGINCLLLFVGNHGNDEMLESSQERVRCSIYIVLQKILHTIHFWENLCSSIVKDDHQLRSHHACISVLYPHLLEISL